ncbi:MAG: PIN domain-containing protein [Cyclobacteriaceae bacterium]
MKELFVDTNIVIDLLAKREPFYSSAARLFSLADKSKVKLSVSSLTFSNTNYILSRQKTFREARAILRNFKMLVSVLPLDEKIVMLALNDSKFADFEDGLQYHSAVEFDQEIIITRNQKDFKSSKIPVMTAEEYLISR